MTTSSLNSTPTQKRSFNRLPRETRMHDIEAAARDMFSTYGYQAASMAQIAERAGVVEGTIYKYYSGKRDLLLTVLLRWYEGMIADYFEALKDVAGTRARLSTIIRQHFESIKANPDLVSLFYSEVRGKEDYYDSELFEQNRRYTEVLVQVLQRGVEQGELRADLPFALTRDIVFGGMEHHVSAFLSGRGDFDIGETTNGLVGLVMNGVAMHPENDLENVVKRLERVASHIEQKKIDKGK